MWSELLFAQTDSRMCGGVATMSTIKVAGEYAFKTYPAFAGVSELPQSYSFLV